MKIKYMLILILGMFLTINSYSQSVSDSVSLLNKRPIDPLVGQGFLFFSVNKFGRIKFFLTPKSAEPRIQLSGIPYYITKVQPIKND